MRYAKGLSSRQIGQIGKLFCQVHIAASGYEVEPVDLSTCDLLLCFKEKLIRIEVKTQMQATVKNRGRGHKPGQMYYRFMTGRIKKGKLVPYAPGSLDLLALVGIQDEQVAFLLPSEIKPRMNFPALDQKKPQLAIRRWEDYSLDRALKLLAQERDTAKTATK